MGKKKQGQNETNNIKLEKELSAAGNVEVVEQKNTEQETVETVKAVENNKTSVENEIDKKEEQQENVVETTHESKVEPELKKRVGNITVEKKKNIVGLNKTLVVTAVILFIIAIAAVVFAVINKLNNNVYHNVYLNGVNLEGKTESEVAKYIYQLNESFKTKTLVIKNDEQEIIEITPASIDMAIDEIATKAQIMAFGRAGNILDNNLDIIKAYFDKHEIDIVYYYSEAKLSNIAAEVSASIEGRVIDDYFTVDDEKNVLVITKGTAGKSIIVNQFKQDVLNAFKEKDSDTYNVALEDAQPKAIDVDVVYAQVAKAAKDAYVDNTVQPALYHKHELGITFDKVELRDLLAKEENQKEGKVIKFNLTTTKPAVTIQDITKDLYMDTLGKYTSEYVNSDSNRASNVVLAAKMLNGTIIMPGETFSFNKVMGDCGLASRGFKSAAVFKNGKVVQEIGGGVCQISSTLYIAALYANMSIVSRSNHALPVGYVPASLDATIYYPYTDFKFKNTRNYPVKIVAKTTSSRKLTISICGTKEDVEYEIVLTSKKTGSIAPKVQEQQDGSLAVGKTKVIQSGAYGYTSVAYKTVKLNGKVISKTLLSEDSYGSTPKIIAVGTKQVNIYGE